MGGAIAGMHYTAMEAAVFYPLTGVDVSGVIYSPETVAIIIAVFAALGAGVTFTITTTVKRRELTRSLMDEIARRHASEQEVRTERARLGAIFDAAVDAILTVDRAGKILQWSKGAQRDFRLRTPQGNRRPEIRRLLMPEPYRSRHANHMGAYLRTGVDAKLLEVPGARSARGVRQGRHRIPGGT